MELLPDMLIDLNNQKTMQDKIIERAVQHGRFQMLAEITEKEFPLTNTRLVNLLSELRGWKSLTREQKELAVRACGDKRDMASLERAIKIARGVK